jgi:hypothetical protein
LFTGLILQQCEGCRGGGEGVVEDRKWYAQEVGEVKEGQPQLVQFCR